MYRRVLLKLSGERIGDCERRRGISRESLLEIADEISAAVRRTKVQLGVVIGAGNLLRGRDIEFIERTTADYMGMLSTVINACALQAVLEHRGVVTRVMTAIEIPRVAEPYIRRRAVRHLEKGRVVIFAAGTGNPYFTTDTAAALRAVEIGADVLIKATQVDGVYSADPRTNPRARRFRSITFMDAIRRKLGVMDATAFTLCMENRLPVVVFDMYRRGNLLKVLQESPSVGTVIRG